MKTSAIFFAFDLFGSSGTAEGVHLLADELREVLADNRRETVATRARAYTRHVRIEELDFPDLETCATWRHRGRALARQAIEDRRFLLWFSGNHLGTLPVYDELCVSGESVLVVQFDAHLDIHHFRDCEPQLSHGNFLLHCEATLPPLVNVGHRDLLLPADYIAQTFRRAISASELAVDPARVLGELRTLASQASAIYLDIDCDVFDPSFFPAVCEPVPFGPTPAALLGVLDAIWSDRIRGVFVSEFAPGRDREDRSLAALIWLIEYLLLRRYETG